MQAAGLDYRAAVNKMLAIVPNGSITELSLGDANGTTVWEADVWDSYIVEHKVTINAASGELIATSRYSRQSPRPCRECCVSASARRPTASSYPAPTAT